MRVVIVGGGIVGTMHAIEARQRGHDVVHLERDAVANSASVRNFGHILVSGRAPGVELEVAAQARARWQELAALVPKIGFRPVGTLNVALSEEESAVHAEVAARDDATDRGFRMLTPSQAAQLQPGLGAAVCSGLYSDRDARVEPRQAVHQLQAFLAEGLKYLFLPERTIVEIDETSVVDHTGTRHDGDVILLCTGADHTLLDPAAPLHRCQLQMFETRPLGTTLDVSITDVGSLRYYPAFAGPAVDALGAPSDLEARWRLQLLAVQRLDGSLTIGDTHVYDEPFSFDYDVDPEVHLTGKTELVLGVELPPIERRWLGVYSKCLDDARIEYRASVAEGVWAITGLGGRGMTLSPAVARRTFEEIER